MAATAHLCGKGQDMDISLEFHPGDGGADAEAFAAELAGALGQYFDRPVVRAGRLLRLERL